MDIIHDVLFKILLHADIDTLKIACNINIFNEICLGKYFWKQKFIRDNLIIIKEQNDIDAWIAEYIKIKKYTNDANDIITISLKEKEMNMHDGTIIVNFNDNCYMRYENHTDIYYLPQELNSMVSERFKEKDVDKIIDQKNLDRLDFSPHNKYLLSLEYEVDKTIYPSKLNFTPNDDKYLLEYEVIVEKSYKGGSKTKTVDFNIFVSINEIKNILINALYDEANYIHDNDEYRYLYFEGEDPDDVNETRLLIRESLKCDRL